MLKVTTSDRETSMRLYDNLCPPCFRAICVKRQLRRRAEALICRRCLCFRVLAAICGLAGSIPANAHAASVTFNIADATDPAEVTEATTVFINGKQVAHFELSATHPYAEVQVTIPQAERYDYALCGRITVRAADGHSETHVLDDGATLLDPGGRRWEALAADGFTTFYLGERSGDNGTPAPRDLHRTNVCSIPVS